MVLEGVGVRVPSGIEPILTLLPTGEGERWVLCVVGLPKAPGGVKVVPAAWTAPEAEE